MSSEGILNMNIDPLSETLGQLVQNQKNMSGILNKIDNKVDVLKEFQSATETRLKHGADHFNKLDKADVEHKKDLSTIEKKNTV